MPSEFLICSSLGWGLRIHIFATFSGDADATSLRTTLEHHCPRRQTIWIGEILLSHSLPCCQGKRSNFVENDAERKELSTCSSAIPKIFLSSWPKLAVGILDPSTHLGERPSSTLKVYTGALSIPKGNTIRILIRLSAQLSLQSCDWSLPLDFGSS